MLYLSTFMLGNLFLQCVTGCCRYLAGAFTKDQETCLAKVLGLYQVRIVLEIFLCCVAVIYPGTHFRREVTSLKLRLNGTLQSSAH